MARWCDAGESSRGTGHPAGGGLAGTGRAGTGRAPTGRRGGGAATPRVHPETVARIERSMGALGTAAMASDGRAAAVVPRDVRGEQVLGRTGGPGGHRRVRGVVQAPGRSRPAATEVFGTAPRELTRAVRLQQTVEIVRVVIDVVEAQVDKLAAPGGEAELREAVLLLHARDRVRRRPGVRAGRGGARRLGRPARGADRRLAGARRGRRVAALLGVRARLVLLPRRGDGRAAVDDEPSRSSTSCAPRPGGRGSTCWPASRAAG